MSSSVPGLLSSPSWGKTQISRSMAHLYSSMSGKTPSRAAQPDDGIDLQVSAHVGSALEDALLQSLFGALAHVPGLKQLFCLRHLSDGFVQRSLLGPAAVQQAGFVQVDVGFDEAGRNQAPADIDLLSVRGEAWLDGGDAAPLDADVHRRPVLLARDSPVSQDEIHVVLPTAGRL